MNAKRYHFQLLNGRKVVADTECTFMGNRQFQNWDGDRWQINSDYNGMTRLTARKEVAAV